MRKAQKKQAEELVKQIEEAHEQIKQYIAQGGAQFAMELLEDCQNGGITVGTLIEETEGEGHPTVSLLEEYCELVYQIHEDLADNKEFNANKAYKLLRQKLIKVGNSLRNDVPIRTEAVFLPYKASMWDSLESVWKAADADPDCDAYVIPIPYFDKNPDGSFREEHYEGNQYPDYVPVTRYDAFDFGKHMPDVIYIHNAYDDWNLVTSVHPDFYSRNLKNYTEELVYIPYFVLSEIDPDNEQAAEGMKHFCFMPGIINADKVIVQSEDMKKIYVREYIKAAKKCGLTGKHLDRTYLEKKFLGTGSPKFDKVLGMKKEDLEIPDEWLKIIKKPDGTWKKIVFYNNSIGSLLQFGDQMLVKIKDSLQTFEESKEEVALLWRPHPLIESTIKSMRPQLWAEYSQIVERYCSEGWGIYDDTAELDRAVVLSDKYYGDMSSVVWLYKKCNKPVYIQDAFLLSNHEKKINTQIEAGVVVDRVIYYTIPRYNKFYCTDLRNGKTQCIRNTVGRRSEETDYFNHATILGDTIFFFSDENYKCATLNLQTQEIRESCLQLKKGDKLQYLGRYEQNIYFVNYDTTKVYMIRENGVQEFQIEEDRITSTEGIFWYFEREKRTFWKIDVINKIRENHNTLTDSVSLKDDQKIAFAVEKDNNLLIVPDMTDEILVYDLADKSLQRVSLPKITTYLLGGKGALRLIEGSNEKLFFSSMFSSEIFVWENEKMIEIGKTGVGSDDISFYELQNDLYINGLIFELFMDLGVYINS